MSQNFGQDIQVQPFEDVDASDEDAVDGLEDERLPEWAISVVHSRRSGTVAMRSWKLTWKKDEPSGLAYAQVPGATVVATDLSELGEVTERLPALVMRAVNVINRLRTTPFELGVLSYSGDPRIRPAVHSKLAASDVMLVDPLGADGTERAENFVREFRQRSSGQRRNFSKYLEHVAKEREKHIAAPR